MRIAGVAISVFIITGYLLAESSSLSPDSKIGGGITNITASIRVTDLNWSKASLFFQQQDSVASSAGFIEALGSPGDDYAFNVQQTSDGGFIVAER